MKSSTIAVALIAGAAVAGGGLFAAKRMRSNAETAAARAAATTQMPATTTAATAQAGGPIATPAAPSVMEVAPTDLGVSETREVRRELPLTGQLRPIRQAFVRAKVAGEVLEMQVKEGETVKNGQILVRINPAEYQARLDERLATLAGSKATWENNERTRRNNEELLRKNFISQQAYDNTLANSSVALEQVKAAEANVALARKTLDDTILRAPWAGMIAERAAQVGDRAAVDMKLLSLVDLARMEIEAAVPASEIPSVAVGQEVAFRVEGFAERSFTGRVARIAPQSAAGSRSILVYIDMPNTDGTLKGGMFAKGNLTLTRRDSVVAAPIAALREERGDTVVYAIRDGRLARLPVKTGARNDDEAWAEITQGLDAGVQVIKTNLGSMSPGIEVRVTNARGGAEPAKTVAPTPAPALAPAAAKP